MAWPIIPAPTKITARYVKAQHKSRFETGRVLSRAKHARGRRVWELSWTALSQAHLELLLAAFEADQGGVFDWTHPLTLQTHTVGYGADEIEHTLEGIRVDRHDVKVSLEER